MPDPDEDAAVDAVWRLPQSNLPAEQLLVGLVDLIKNSRSAADITPALVSERLHRALSETDPGAYRSVARLTSDWIAAIVVDQEGPEPCMELVFYDNNGRAEPAMTEICGYDAAQLSADLTAAGFVEEPTYGMHGGVIGRDYLRGELRVTVAIRGEADTPQAKVIHSCIQLVQVH